MRHEAKQLLVRQGICSSYFLHFRVRTTRNGDEVVDPTGMHMATNLAMTLTLHTYD